MSTTPARPATREVGSGVVKLVLATLLVSMVVYNQMNLGDLRQSIPSRTGTSSSQLSNSNSDPQPDRSNPLAIPKGQAQNLPSVRVADRSLDQKRTIYGGSGDKKHLGGFTAFDGQGVSPMTWRYMIEQYGVHSLLDVGCGRGVSTSWFLYHGVDILCVEGSHDAVQSTLLPNPATQLVEHDFSRGPWWPAKTYDAVWCVEFLEHVNRQFHYNYITAFRKAALIFATHSRWGGWHHVEVHDHDWWIRKFTSYGFIYDEKMTMEIKAVASQERNMQIPSPNNSTYNAQHIWTNLKVFVNPVVAALPEHAHLFPEHGCYDGVEQITKAEWTKNECN